MSDDLKGNEVEPKLDDDPTSLSEDIEEGADDSAFSSEATEVEAPVEKSKKKPKKKTLMIVLIVLVVLIGAGVVGFNVWHEQPSFCNAICHTPMDPYVESYESNISIREAQVESGVTLSVTSHKMSSQELNCLDCHIPTIEEQVNEAMKWVTGDYEVPLPLMDYDGEEFCLRSECHEGITNRDELGQATADQERNPHNNHLGKIDCSQCHLTHEQSVMLCTQCHGDAEVPEGWLTYSESQAQKKAAAS